MTILCESRYRDSLVRKILVKTTTFPWTDDRDRNSALLRDDQEFEGAVASALGEGHYQHAYRTGNSGPQFQLTSSQEMLLKLLESLQTLSDSGACDAAKEDELVLPLRLGAMTCG